MNRRPFRCARPWPALAAFCPVLILIAFAPSARAASHIVNPDGSGDFPVIQDALNAAASGDSILLGDGVFTGSGNRNLNYLAKTLVVRSQSGDPHACIIDCQMLGRGVTFVSVSSRLAKLAGVTITNGVGDGGAIYCEHSSPTIENCVLENNGTTDRGGGVHCRLSSLPLLSGCLITGNHAQAGGGVYCYSAGAEISQTTISGNSSNGNGAGIWMNVSASVILNDSRVTDNVSSAWGGGIWSSGTILTPSSLTVAASVIAGNQAQQGGGILCIGMAPTFAITQLTGNRATLSDGGGALFYDSDPSFEQCTIAGNVTVTNGGGLALNGSAATFDHCILRSDCASLVGNETYTTGSGAGVAFTCCVIAPAEVGGSGSVVIDANSIDADPLFCDPQLCGDAPTSDGDYTLNELSPAAPAGSPVCGLIGAYDVGCAATSVPGVSPGASVASSATPNPASGMTRIAFHGPASADAADVFLYDTRGRLVRTWSGRLDPDGSGAITWDGTDEEGVPAPAGVYFYRVRIDAGGAVGRLVLVR